MMRKLFRDGDEWQFNGIKLVPTVGDGWIYFVGFGSPVPPLPVPMASARPLKPGEMLSVVGSQPGALMDVIVLMDGRAVEPIVRPFKPGGR
jgi:hypothetical protein